MDDESKDWPVIGASKLDCGIHGIPYRRKGHGERPGRRSVTLLDERIINSVPIVERVGNEYQLGQEVVNMIHEELTQECWVRPRWNNGLGVVRVGTTDVSICARTLSEARRSKTHSMAFEEIVILEGAGNLLLRHLQGTFASRHAINQVSSDYLSGGVAVLEDYNVSAFWPDDNGTRVMLTGQRKVPMTRSVAVSPYQREIAVALEDGRLILLDETMKTLNLADGLNGNCLTFGSAANIVHVAGNDGLSVVDTRRRMCKSIHCLAGIKLDCLGRPDNVGIFACSGAESFYIFDPRMLPRPVLEFEMRKFDCRQISWIDWLGSGRKSAKVILIYLDQLCLYSLERGGTLTIASDVKSGQPVIDSLRVKRPCRGLHVYEDSVAESPTLMILNDCSQLSLWKKSELVNLDILGEAAEEKLNVITPPYVKSCDQAISGIYEANYERVSSEWPTFLQVPELGSLSSAAGHLSKCYDKPFGLSDV